MRHTVHTERVKVIITLLKQGNMLNTTILQYTKHKIKPKKS